MMGRLIRLGCLAVGGTCWSRDRALPGQREAAIFPLRRSVANPEIFHFLEAEGYGYAIPTANQPRVAGQDRILAQASGRATAAGSTPLLRQLRLSGAGP